MSRVFCLTLRLNLQVDSTGHVYETSLRSTLLDRFTDQVYGLSLRVSFSSRVYWSFLRV